MQSDGYGDLIIQSWMPFERLAEFDEAVVENGAGIREDLDEVMDCGESALGGWFNYYMSENMENIKSGLISYQHCEINEGIGASKVVEYNNQEATSLKENNFNGLLAFMDRGSVTEVFRATTQKFTLFLIWPLLAQGQMTFGIMVVGNLRKRSE